MHARPTQAQARPEGFDSGLEPICSQRYLVSDFSVDVGAVAKVTSLCEELRKSLLQVFEFGHSTKKAHSSIVQSHLQCLYQNQLRRISRLPYCVDNLAFVPSDTQDATSD